MKSERKMLLPCLALPLAVSALSALLTGGAGNGYASCELPPLAPPGWVFPVVRTLLCLLMGLSSYLALRVRAPQQEKRSAAWLYLAQLAVSLIWPILFFRLGWRLFAFFWLMLLWLLALLTQNAFSRLSRTAGYLLLPQLLWVAFSGYLNLTVWMLN
ncbi:MAG: TspO/MBR family protein [Candidatus Faecousia sp.]|uniref:TspO/MBR family protein n=1 Tax=Faecousia sp. TaxID=2952921 RepID=UPI002A8B20AE|nr:TspO/MBR family protein [Candidatus Faecousia sp.]